MKTILLALGLTALSLGAQTPPPPAGADAANRSEAARRALRAVTNTAPGTVAPAPVTAIEGRPASAAAAAPKQLIPSPAPPPATAPVSAADATAAAPAPPTLAPAAPANAAPQPTLPAGPLQPQPNPTAPAAATAAPATPPPAAAPPPEEMIPAGMINFTAADINQVLTVYGELVARTILRPAVVGQGSIVLKAQTPLTRKEGIQALEAVLALNGVEMVNIGEKFVKAVPLVQVNAAGAAIRTNAAVEYADLGGYMTHVAQAKFFKPSELVQVLTPFASSATAVMAIDSAGILVLRDHTENVKRMLEMVEKVDVAFQSEFISEVIPIKFAKVEDIASALNALSGGGGGTSIGSSAPAAGRTATPGMSRPGMPGYNPNMPGQTLTPGGIPSAGTPSAGGTFSDRLNQIIRKAASTSGSGDFQIIGPNKIVSDARSNSLLIFASRTDMAMIKDIIAKLDVVLAQVLIETIIMDVSLDDSWNVGVSVAQSPKNLGPNVAGVGGYNTGNPFFSFLSAATNLFPGNTTSTLPPGFSYWGRINESWDVAVQAAAAAGIVNVIQRPRIQTSHATPASIFIGNTVPYVSSTYYGGGYAGGPSSSYQQLSVGIGLNVTPFINPDGLVVMKIDETIDEIASYTKIDNNSVPNTTHRTISAEVAVRDREMIILGGFIRNSETKNNSGVPLLKDIPLLGVLFSSRDSSKSRKELMVLMRPTVLKTPELAALHVKEEKKLLPGIRAAEFDVQRLEQKNIERSKNKNFKETTPFTPEEVKEFGPSPAPGP